MWIRECEEETQRETEREKAKERGGGEVCVCGHDCLHGRKDRDSAGTLTFTNREGDRERENAKERQRMRRWGKNERPSKREQVREKEE